MKQPCYTGLGHLHPSVRTPQGCLIEAGEASSSLVTILFGIDRRLFAPDAVRQRGHQVSLRLTASALAAPYFWKIQMQLENKELTALIRAMKTALKRDHNLEVPHAALRASALMALGQSPHAFAKKTSDDFAELRELVKEAPKYFSPIHDFDGDKLNWLMRAGLVPRSTTETTPAAKKPVLGDTHVVHLVGDDLGCLEVLALDAEGEYPIPDGFDFSECYIVGIDAEIPKVKKYGVPDYLQDSRKFFASRFGLKVDSNAREDHEDSGDDSSDCCKLTVVIPPRAWKLLVETASKPGSALAGHVAEWVGLHYGKAYDKESAASKRKWVQRYLEASSEPEQNELPAFYAAKFEWLWPDQDSDSVPCTVDLATGAVTLKGIPPEDSTGIDFRVVTSDEEENWDQFSAWFDKKYGDTGTWFLTKEALEGLKALLRKA